MYAHMWLDSFNVVNSLSLASQIKCLIFMAVSIRQVGFDFICSFFYFSLFRGENEFLAALILSCSNQMKMPNFDCSNWNGLNMSHKCTITSFDRRLIDLHKHFDDLLTTNTCRCGIYFTTVTSNIAENETIPFVHDIRYESHTRRNAIVCTFNSIEWNENNVWAMAFNTSERRERK